MTRGKSRPWYARSHGEFGSSGVFQQREALCAARVRAVCDPPEALVRAARPCGPRRATPPAPRDLGGRPAAPRHLDHVLASQPRPPGRAAPRLRCRRVRDRAGLRSPCARGRARSVHGEQPDVHRRRRRPASPRRHRVRRRGRAPVRGGRGGRVEEEGARRSRPLPRRPLPARREAPREGDRRGRGRRWRPQSPFVVRHPGRRPGATLPPGHPGRAGASSPTVGRSG